MRILIFLFVIATICTMMALYYHHGQMMALYYHQGHSGDDKLSTKILSHTTNQQIKPLDIDYIDYPEKINYINNNNSRSSMYFKQKPFDNRVDGYSEIIKSND